MINAEDLMLVLTEKHIKPNGGDNDIIGNIWVSEDKPIFYPDRRLTIVLLDPPEEMLESHKD